MKTLYEYQELYLTWITDEHFRFLYHRLLKGERIIAIKGPKGTGKTSLLLKWLKYELGQTLQKPDKIYLKNTNLSYALKGEPNHLQRLHRRR